MKYFFFLLLFSAFAFFGGDLFAQSCSNEAITAKYWQYRKNLNKHFVVMDRDPSGCIHDGIGQSSSDPCVCSKAGYGLPATSINIADNGEDGKGDRKEDDPVWKDKDCADDDGDPLTPGVGRTNNWLDMGSETPHQMGWHWLTLATEYQLLKENGQNAEAQRTLEELFLGLQAYRRLDIQANCIARQRYQEITDGIETDWLCFTGKYEGFCLCAGKYTTHDNFHVPCKGGCSYTPNTSGYSGFFLREDATQELEKKLHDTSEDKWNIDLVGGNCYSMSLNPPCTTTFSQACYLEHRRGFMSQDGVFGLMIGLTMIKRFIPPSATVTLCDGTTHSPLSMAVQIASNITNRIDNTTNDGIAWPKSYDCCGKEVFLGGFEGGSLNATMHGLKKACSYIDGAERHSDIGEAVFWGGLALQTRRDVKGYQPFAPLSPLAGFVPIGDNSNFWVRLKTLGWDMGGAGSNSLYQDAFRATDLQIMPLINNLLYPAEPNMGIDKEYFRNMLCSAPCGGPCEKSPGYPDGDPAWPEFECPNNPDWIGQRWEAHDPISNTNRQFNGLDFMALYNLYLLFFPEERTVYFNPDRPEQGINLGAGQIEGPDVLCPVNVGRYKVLKTAPAHTIQSVTWQSSSNLEKIWAQGNEADFRANLVLHPAHIQAMVKESREVQQYYDEAVRKWITPPC